MMVLSVPQKRKARVLIVAFGGVMALCFGLIASQDSFMWRARILADKATGRVTDIGWSDLLWMLRPGSGIYLAQLAESRNPFAAIESPRNTREDIDLGRRLFAEHCSTCHGDGGRGGLGGPALVGRTLHAGQSDWALYRTITLGVPGTGMVAWELPRKDVWRLVSYLHHALTAPNAPQFDRALIQFAPVAAGEIADARNHPETWLTYSGSYDAQRHSRLNQINRDNIGNLRVAWTRQFETTADRVEATPIVRGSTMFVTEPPNRVHALDAASGEVIWTYTRQLPQRLLLCCAAANRGVALLGNRLFVGTLDAHLIALDASTGKVVWDVNVAGKADGFSITGAPLVVDDMVVTGVAGGEFGVRGFIDAYDAASGKRRWRFYTVPAPGEPGSESWAGDSWRSGGAPTWLTGSFDPQLRMIYWGTGNPSPNFYGENRKGDNLYSDSVVALDADTGKLRWHFQFTPHDVHDWDAVQIPLLVDRVIDNSPRKLLVAANRNGFYYVLDRTNGQFLRAAPFVRQNWADGLDANGRPNVRGGSAPSREGSLVYPGVSGATNWESPSYDPTLGLIYVPSIDRGSIFYSSPNQRSEYGAQRLGGGFSPIPDDEASAAVKALDVATGEVRWQYVRPMRETHTIVAGILSTAGRLVFGGDLETFFALDSETGRELWRFDTGGRIVAAPISYRVEGKQYIAIAAGRSIFAFAIDTGKPLTKEAKAAH